jgi:hypothetical protein
MLIFDEEKINELKKIYKYEVEDQEKFEAATPNCGNEPENEDTHTLELESEGSESSEGSRVCGFIIE